MEKLMLSADGDIMLYEVDKQILNDFDNLIDEFFIWKKTNCYTEQLFIKFLQQKYESNKIKFIKNIGSIVPKEYKDIKYYNF